MSLLHRRTPREVPAPTGARKAGDIVRVRREDSGVDLVAIVSTWTTPSGVLMLTVVNRPFGFHSITVRSDMVLADDEPDVRDTLAGCREDAVVEVEGVGYCEAHRSIGTKPQWDGRDALMVRPIRTRLSCGQQATDKGANT